MATVLGTFSVLKDYIKVKINQDAAVIDNIGKIKLIFK